MPGSPDSPEAIAEAEKRAELSVLPYLQGYREAGDQPVITAHDRKATAPGLNLYTSGHAAEAVLMTSSGQVLHRWRYPLRRVWPELYEERPEVHQLEYWRRAYLYPDGRLLAIFEGLGLIQLDAESRLLWAFRSGAHHDLFVRFPGDSEREEIWVLDRRGQLIPRLHSTEGILEDLVTVLDAQGQVKRQISLLEAFESSPYASWVDERLVATGDIFHTNTVKRLEGPAARRLAQEIPAFTEGNLLLSVLQFSALAILDPQTESIVWAQRGPWRKQHEPTLTPRGGVLLFDNVGPGRVAGAPRSRVLEFDPRQPLPGEGEATSQLLFSYGGTADVPLFSRTLSTATRLPNGNTLITESENGRAFELTPEKRIVWEMYNPHRAGEQNELVATLFHVERLPGDFSFGFKFRYSDYRGDEP